MAQQMPYVQQFAKVPYGMPLVLDEAASSITLRRSALLVDSWPTAGLWLCLRTCLQLCPVGSLSPTGLVCDHQQMPLAPCIRVSGLPESVRSASTKHLSWSSGTGEHNIPLFKLRVCPGLCHACHSC